MKILHEDNRASEYVYNEEIGYHLLKTAYGADGAFVEYAYTNTGENRVDGLPHCITHATVTGTKNGTTLTAANVSYTYGNHMALVKDEISGKTLRYHFNDDGNQTSVDDELGGSMIIENIFGIPGIGNLYINSINVRDYNFFMALNVFYTAIGLVSGIVIDISYGFIDPRIRMGSKK